jgi:uncharacterized phiE125 gp8 family phage protein
MSTRIVTEPTVEPLTLAEVKTHLHEDLSDASNDALITTLIAVARQAAEHRTQRALMLQTLEQTLDAFPVATDTNPLAAIELEMPPVVDVTSVTYTDADGATITLSNTLYTLDAAREPAQLVPSYSAGKWPATQGSVAAVRVRYRAGYSTSATASVAQAAVPAAHAAVDAAGRRRHVRAPHRQRGRPAVRHDFVDALLDRYRIWSL